MTRQYHRQSGKENRTRMIIQCNNHLILFWLIVIDPLGGHQLLSYMQKVLQLRYQNHANALTFSR